MAAALAARLIVGVVVSVAWADDRGVRALDAVHVLRVAPQPLGDALRDLARQARLQLMFDAGVVADYTSPAIEGRLTSRDALRRLLARTDLVATEPAPGVIVIKRSTPR